jgi:hypothetical protein
LSILPHVACVYGLSILPHVACVYRLSILPHVAYVYRLSILVSLFQFSLMFTIMAYCNYEKKA